MKQYITILFLFLGGILFAQTAPDKYWINFTDKDNTPFSIDQPEEFLSYRAIDRRRRYSIAITEQDLPVNPQYISAVRELGAKILTRSKWFNGISIFTQDSTVLQQIRSLDFVRSIKSIKILSGQYPDNKEMEFKDLSGFSNEDNPDTTYFHYGKGANQIGMLNGHIIHNQGFHGQGMVICILDGGFTNANTNPAFDSLWQGNQILGTWDFVIDAPVEFNKHVHGSMVLSTMGANLPGSLVGTAPKASFYLLRTEDGATEYLIEEDNWVAGAEFADSVGTDLINSSLGYTKFDDESMNHSYDDLDGNTTRITQGADIAASKGILVVTSASNEGHTEWHYIGAPADGDSVLSVGAVDSLGNYAGFSSTGPTFDGRIKPNVCAQGMHSAIASSNGNIIFGNGTSFSSPIMCGMTACLWQSNKSLSNMDIIKALESSASQAENPDSLLGYGIPDCSKAFFVVQGIDSSDIGEESLVRTYPNPFTTQLSIEFFTQNPGSFDLRIMDLQGRVVYKKSFSQGYVNFYHIRLTDLNKLAVGTYLLQIISQTNHYETKIIRQTN
ncbi:MAG: S8 family serine peptidase [Bacteroidales bacterium]|nr:S8 family serine peptidase [Bacteroidales bacterium]